MIETAGLLKYLAREARWHYHNKLGIYRLTRREGVEIRQGTTVISPERLFCEPPLRIEAGNFLHCGGNSWSGGEGEIRFGKNCWLAHNNVLYGAGGIEFGDCSGTGPGVLMFSSRNDYSRELAPVMQNSHVFAPIKVGSYVCIFSGSIVTPGVTIGDGAIIGANSVVMSDIPPWTIAAGAPARVVKERDKDSMH